MSGDLCGDRHESEIRPYLGGRSDLADEELVACVLGEVDGPGCDDAFEELFNRHSGAVARIVSTFVRRSDDIQDIVQTTFMKAYFSLNHLTDRSKFRYWIRVIALNEAKDLSRNHQDWLGLDEALTLPERDDSCTPADVIEARWLVDEINERLPAPYAQILRLRYYLDYSVNEVAKMLNIDPGLVKWRASRARHMASSEIKRMDIPNIEEE